MRRFLLPFGLFLLGCPSSHDLLLLRGELQVMPEVLDFGFVALGSSESLSLRVENIGKSDLSIQRISLTDQGGIWGPGPDDPFRLMDPDTQDPVFSLGPYPVLAPGQSLEIPVHFTPGSHVEYSNTILLESNALEEPWAVPVLGDATTAPGPDITVSPLALDFGATLRDTSSILNLSIASTGTADLELGALYITGSTGFSLLPPSLDNALLQPTETRALALQFTPDFDLLYEAELHIPSNDPDEPDTLVLLSGERKLDGTEPQCDLQVTSGASPNGPLWEALPLQTVSFSAANSFSPNYPSNQLTPQWSLTQAPVGSAAWLQAFGLTASLNPDLVGQYVVRLMVTDPSGIQSAPCEVVIDVLANENFRIEMFWTYANEDMDLHVLRGSGFLNDALGDCYYSNCQGCPGGWGSCPDWGTAGSTVDDPALDLDDISGTGPENTNIVAPVADTYKIYVHDYPGTGDFWSPNPTTIRVYLNGVLTQTLQSNANAATQNWGDSEDNYWKVLDIDWPSGALTPHWQICATPC